MLGADEHRDHHRNHILDNSLTTGRHLCSGLRRAYCDNAASIACSEELGSLDAPERIPAGGAFAPIVGGGVLSYGQTVTR